MFLLVNVEGGKLRLIRNKRGGLNKREGWTNFKMWRGALVCGGWTKSEKRINVDPRLLER